MAGGIHDLLRFYFIKEEKYFEVGKIFDPQHRLFAQFLRQRNFGDHFSPVIVFSGLSFVLNVCDGLQLNVHSPSKISSGCFPPNSMRSGCSHISFTFTRKPTDSLPSMMRWSYESATYIIGRITTCPFTATGLSITLCIP